MIPRYWTIGSCLIGATALLAGLAGGVSLAMLPPSVRLDQGPARPTESTNFSTDWNRLDSLEAYDVISTRPLRQDLFPREERREPLRLELLYTVISSDRRSALLKTADGETLEVLPGQHIQGATVTTIEDGAVILQRDGQEIIVTLPREGS